MELWQRCNIMEPEEERNQLRELDLFPEMEKSLLMIESLDEYFGLETMKVIVKQPLVLTDTISKFDVLCKVVGGGYYRSSRCNKARYFKSITKGRRRIKTGIEKGRILNKRPENEGKKEIRTQKSEKGTTVFKEIIIAKLQFTKSIRQGCSIYFRAVYCIYYYIIIKYSILSKHAIYLEVFMLLIKNGKIITMSGVNYDRGYILVEQGKIVAVGETIDELGNKLPDEKDVVDNRCRKWLCVARTYRCTLPCRHMGRCSGI